MALLITDECISCGACLPECPNEAIFETRSDAEAKGYHVGDGQGVGDSIYVITHGDHSRALYRVRGPFRRAAVRRRVPRRQLLHLRSGLSRIHRSIIGAGQASQSGQRDPPRQGPERCSRVNDSPIGAING